MRKQGNVKKLMITALSLLVFAAGLFGMNLSPEGNGSKIDGRIEAFAEETRVTTANLNLRTGPGTSYSVILVIPKGATVTVTGYSGSWAQVTYGGRVGYASTSYLSSPSTSSEVRYTTSNLNLRTGPGTGYTVILVIPKGASVNLVSISSGWAQVIYSGRTGYVSATYLSTGAPVSSPGASQYTYTTLYKLNLRSGPSTSYSVLVVIPQGTPITVLETANGWHKASYGGKTGYVSAGYVAISPSRSSVEAFINNRGTSSSTGSLIWVDTEAKYTYVFTGSARNWKLQRAMLSTVGKPSTPTIKGTFTVGAKGSYFTVDANPAWICKNYTQFLGDYLIHSIVYDRYGNIVDGRLGMELSLGCVRVSMDNATYIHNNVPRGSTVYVN
jgi:uncharacterized protein YgiM (DUF1202 family)